MILHECCHIKLNLFLVWLQKNYKGYDGFVILHGTDTMAYTASALSFMCEDLGKPVILTGAQVRPSDFKRLTNKFVTRASRNFNSLFCLFRCPSMSWGMMAETTCWGRCSLLANMLFLRWEIKDVSDNQGYCKKKQTKKQTNIYAVYLFVKMQFFPKGNWWRVKK